MDRKVAKQLKINSFYSTIDGQIVRLVRKKKKPFYIGAGLRRVYYIVYFDELDNQYYTHDFHRWHSNLNKIKSPKLYHILETDWPKIIKYNEKE